MTRPDNSRDADYFNRLYQANPDPWDFVGSPYERRKYDATVAALGGRRFGSGFEVGCSIGVLTARLAARCDRLLAIDVAPQALAEASRRCAAFPQVKFECRRVPEAWPAAQSFDLIVLSEMLYFLTPEDNAKVAAHAAASLAPDGIVVLVNFTGRIDEPCGGEEAASLFIAGAAPALLPVTTLSQETYRIDVLQRRG